MFYSLSGPPGVIFLDRGIPRDISSQVRRSYFTITGELVFQIEDFCSPASAVLHPHFSSAISGFMFAKYNLLLPSFDRLGVYRAVLKWNREHKADRGIFGGRFLNEYGVRQCWRVGIYWSIFRFLRLLMKPTTWTPTHWWHKPDKTQSTVLFKVVLKLGSC